MARTSEGRELTEKHRKGQAGIVKRMLKVLLGIWDEEADYRNIDQSSLSFARRAAPEVMKFRAVSREYSKDYLVNFRDLEVPEADRKPIADVVDNYSLEDALQEMWTAARASMKKVSAKGYNTQDGLEAGRNAVSGKATKLVADGGRKVIKDDIDRGNGPVGYARVVDADPCAFCAMLASRGVSYTGYLADGEGLYRTDSFAASNSRFVGKGDFKVHDGCQCTMEPVYKVGGKIRLPGRGDELARNWARVAAGERDPLKAWQRWWNSGTLPETYDGPLQEGEKRPKPPRKKVKPQTKAERSGAPVKKWSELEDTDFLAWADDLEQRLVGVDAELAELKALGKDSEDIAVFALEQQRKAFLSQIEKYRAQAMKM